MYELLAYDLWFYLNTVRTTFEELSITFPSLNAEEEHFYQHVSYNEKNLKIVWFINSSKRGQNSFDKAQRSQGIQMPGVWHSSNQING